MRKKLIIVVPKEIAAGENRVAITPDTAAKLIKSGFEIYIENNAGLNAGFLNTKYEAAGAKIIDDPGKLYALADIVLKVQKPLFNSGLQKHELDLIKSGALLISFLYASTNSEMVQKGAEKGVNLFAMDSIPRITKAQRMDALSSQASLGGYKAVMLCANALGKIFPLMMTAAGTISPAKVVIMGAGVAGLQALGTARRLGAVVEVSDIRPQVKEEVQSLGGRFIEVETDASMQDKGGYAKEVSQEFLQKQKALIFKHVTEADIVIATALVPGKKAPVLITEEMIKNMRQGSVVLDMAVEFGGNCELSEMGKTVEKYGVKIIGEPNLPALVPVHASEMYSKNILNLLQYLVKDGSINYNFEDEILNDSLITYQGKIRKTF